MIRVIFSVLYFLMIFFPKISLSQTCCGTIQFKVTDSVSNKNICKKLIKSINYFNVTKSGEYYNLNEKIIPFGELQSDSNIYYVNNKINSWVSKNESKIEFATHCGYYLVRQTLILNSDTMEIGFYNIPAHYTFKIEDIEFKKGNFYFNLGIISKFKEGNVGYSVLLSDMGKFQ